LADHNHLEDADKLLAGIQSKTDPSVFQFSFQSPAEFPFSGAKNTLIFR
jgi:hypothetical protein